jgi:hypothetical protein
MAIREGQQVDTMPNQIYGWDGSAPVKLRASSTGALVSLGYATPPGWQSKYDKAGRTDGQDVYIGFSLMGSADTDAVWIIYKNTFDGNGFIAHVQSVENGQWQLRATYF